MKRPMPLGILLFWAVEATQRRLGLKANVAKLAADPLEKRRGGGAPGWIARRGPTDLLVTDISVPGRGGAIPVRTYSPMNPAGLLPAVVFFHGGGWFLGCPEGADHVCRRIAKDAGVVVLNVDYRLAPEDIFPAGYDDCVDVVTWVSRSGASIGVDPARLAVAGDSAGGNLAASVALAAVDADLPVLSQILIYPALDARMNDPWMHAYRGPGLQLNDCHDILDVYLGGDRALRTDPRVSPLLAPDVSGVAPALILTGDIDILRDHGRLYAEKLLGAGVPARWITYPRAPHAFISLDRVCKDALPAIALIVEELRARLGTQLPAKESAA